MDCRTFILVIFAGIFAFSGPNFTRGHFLRPGKNIVWSGDQSMIYKVTTTTTTPASTSQCICVPYYLCDSNNTIITDGIGVIDVRFRRCTGDLEVCCYLPNFNTSSPRPIPTAIPTGPPTTVTTMSPIVPPTMMPTMPPTMPPTMSPTMIPTMPPTMTPTMMPTMPPTMSPTIPPTMSPTMPPTMTPTMPPTTMLTMPPTMPPTMMPTMPPTMTPTMPPTTMPTMPPTMPPTMMPTMPPTMPPTMSPTTMSTMPPTMSPTTMSTMPPTMAPTMMPTTSPTMSPTIPPTMMPTVPPTMPPTTMSTMPPTTASTMPPTTSPVTVFPTTVPNLNCVCVEPYQCDASGVIIISGAGVIDPRQQQGICPIATQVCCRIPATSVVFPTQIQPLTSMAPVTSNQMCVCVKTWQCDSMGYVIVSGAGSIDPRFPTGRVGQIGTVCTTAGEICCKIPSNGQDSSAVSPSDALQPSASGTLGPIRNPGTERACICVPTLQCSAGFVVSQDGAGIIDPRFGICPIAEDVCCRLQGIVPVASSQSSGRQTLIPAAGGTSLTYDSCGVKGPSSSTENSSSDGPGATSFAEFPWMVALLVRQTASPSLFQCGASLLTTRAVLTAAHCIVGQEASKLVVRLGEWDTRSTSESLPFQETGVQMVLRHPQFYSGGLYHDVAVLILTSEVTYQLNVRPICLPQQGMVLTPGVRCIATGWGRNAFGVEGQYQAVLRQVDLPIIERSECQTRLRSTRLGPYFQLHGSFMCAGGEPSKDTCTGDGGGPLVCPTSAGKYVQIGIVSWGIGCGASSTPAVYASVSQYRQWIDQQLANYGVL